MGYHTPQEEKEAPFINNPDLIPVPVLASFSLDGKMIPVYFAVEGLKIKIDSVVWGKEGLAWGSHYRCRICTSGITDEINLMYFKNQNTWVMKKMR